MPKSALRVTATFALIYTEQLRSYPSKRSGAQFEDQVVRPGLEEIAAEFDKLGYEGSTYSPRQD